MSDLSHEPVQSPQARVVQPEAPATTVGPGNAETQERLRTPGQLTWEGALGEHLGGRLYEALAAQLTDEKLVGHAHSAVDQAIAALKSALAGQGSMTEEDAAALFAAELDKALKQIAQDAVVKSGLSEGIRDFADANPYAIALSAAAGAVAWVLSNQDLPLFEGKLGLGGGHALVGGIDPGRTLAFALERVRVGYRYDGDRIAARLRFDRYQDGHEAEAGLEHQLGDGSALAITGTHTDRGGEERAGVGATWSDRARSDELQRRLSGQWWSDGAWEASGGVSRTEKDRSWSLEAFGGQTATGQENYGVRALFKLRF